MAVDPDAANREFVANNMDADLQFILGEAGVSVANQAAIARRYGTLRKFTAIGDDRAALRTACLQDFAIPQDTPDNRAEVASIVASWETAKDFMAKEVELRAEAKVMGQPSMASLKKMYALFQNKQKFCWVNNKIVLNTLQRTPLETPSNFKWNHVPP